MNPHAAATAGDVPPRDNPYSSRFVRPGAVAFLYDDGATAESLVDRFLALGGCGAVVGPHGSGKSTLLSELQCELRRRGFDVAAVELHDGARGWKGFGASASGPRTVVTIDGFEQLSTWRRWFVRVRLKLAGARLLATMHEAGAWPVVYRTRPSREQALHIARRLSALHASEEDADRIAPDEVARLFDAHQGNVREVLFRLYDLYELRRR